LQRDTEFGITNPGVVGYNFDAHLAHSDARPDFMPVTSKDIARELNLSQPTVSRILNGDQKHRASTQTRERVWETARRLGYRPNAIARSLRRGRTDIIGVHSGSNYDVRNDFLGAIVGAVQTASADLGYDVLLHRAESGSSTEALFAKLRDGRIDGLILHTNAEDPLVGLLRESSLPVVAVADALPGLTAVTNDDCAGMTGLLEELWRRGYRRFAYLKPHLRLLSVEQRAQVYAEFLRSRGVAAADRLVFESEMEMTEAVLPALLELRRAGGPLAVCCWNDRTAYDLLRNCSAQFVRVPHDLAVAGFDGFRDEKLPARQLLTVGCAWDEVARVALGILVERIEAAAEDESDQPSQQEREIALPAVLLDGDTA